MVNKLAANFNGISIAYAMGLLNAALSLLLAFGVTLTLQQQTSIVALANAAMIVLAHIGHRVGEAYAHVQAAPAVLPAGIVEAPPAAPPAAAPQPAVVPSPSAVVGAPPAETNPPSSGGG